LCKGMRTVELRRVTMRVMSRVSKSQEEGEIWDQATIRGLRLKGTNVIVSRAILYPSKVLKLPKEILKFKILAMKKHRQRLKLLRGINEINC
jgi:hypothetical protein